MGILNNSNAISVDSGYDITDSLRFRSSASAYLNRTPASTGNRKTWTWSSWIKRGALGGVVELLGSNGSTDNTNFAIEFDNDNIFIGVYSFVVLKSTAVLRDPSAWYHLVVTFDSTQSTASNRIKVYINGVEITSWSTDNRASITLNGDYGINNNTIHNIGRNPVLASRYYDGYLTEVNLVDGTALAPTDFGESDSNGTWIPKKYTGTYGTNGFYLPMKPTTQATGFNTVLYTGNGGTQSITGVGFSPDLVWVKSRTSANSHNLIDSVRGATKHLFSNTVDPEYTYSNGLTSFNADGFSVGDLADVGGTNNYVAWCWDAGSSTVTNTDGTISAQVRANPSTGFSIVTYTGTGSNATIGHGLGVAPKMIIAKSRSYASTYWLVGHDSIGWTKGLYLNDNRAEQTYTPYWNDTAPVSDKFTLGTWTDANGSGHTNVAYCFADVTGYQKIDSYTGNGSATGPTITTGFRPAFVMVKRTDVAKDWIIIDNTRDVNNPAKHRLFPNLSDAESTSQSPLELLDDGFKVVVSDSNYNATGGTYIYLAIKDTRDEKFNFDASGNKNNWTPNNINSNASGDSTYDLMSDVPTLTDEDTANFSTFNGASISHGTLTNGNLTFSDSSSGETCRPATIAASSGKFYWEVTLTAFPSTADCYIGIADIATLNTSTDFVGERSDSYSYYQATSQTNSRKVNGASFTETDTTIGAAGAVIQVALDLDAGKIWFGRNNSWINSGNPSAGTNEAFSSISGTKIPAVTGAGAGVTTTFDINFGQRPFAYTPPTGFKKLNTFNLPDSTITDGSEHFDNKLYTGNASTQSITGLDFSPDLTWIKVRNSASYEHMWFDSVRGVTKYIRSNTTSAEGTVASTLTSFDSNGFSLGNNNDVNGSGFPIVAWNWRGSDSTAASNTDGDITSTVSANTTAGFSIVTYTGNTTDNATIGHGLSSAPEVVITKNRGASTYWYVYHSSLSATNNLYLNRTDAQQADNVIKSTSASTFTVSNSTASNGTEGMVAYCFAEVEGYSKFDKYTGNGSTDGPFVYTGFRPSWIMIKRTDTTGTWAIWDSTRNSSNGANFYLMPDLADAEGTDAILDLNANGFKIRTSFGSRNASSGTYIYMAFAENPFKNSNAR